MIDKEFIQNLRERVEGDPSSILFAKLGDMLRQNKEYEDAVNVLKKGLDYHKNYATAHFILAKCYEELGWQDDAIQKLEETLQYDRDNISAMKMLAELLYNRRDYKRALGKFNELLILSPADREETNKYISDLENILKKLEEEQRETEKEIKKEETKDTKIIEENKEDENQFKTEEDMDGPLKNVSGIRELTLDSLDVDIANKSTENKEIIEKNKEVENVDKDLNEFNTLTMAQVCISQKQYKKAKEILLNIKKENPFDDKVNSLIAQVDNIINEESQQISNRDEKEEITPSVNEKAMKLSELFESLNKNAIKKSNEDKKEKIIDKVNHEENRDKVDKKEVNKFKDWLKGL